jgi:uncharacterized low-complexity protein
MTKKPMKKSIALAVSAALATSLAASPMTQANSTPAELGALQASTLDGGYMQFVRAKDREGKCGDVKTSEGKCGEGECGDAKTSEGKCGEGKCGGA